MFKGLRARRGEGARLVAGSEAVGAASPKVGRRRRGPRAQLRGGDPIRGGHPLGAGHAGSHHRGVAAGVQGDSFQLLRGEDGT